MSIAFVSRLARQWTHRCAGALLAVAMAFSPAWAKDGIQTDLTILTFSYQVTNPNAQEGEVIGRIAVADGAISALDLLKLDLGGDNVFGGGDDTVLDIAEIDDSDEFDVLLSGDVVKLGGSNNYTLVGGISVTDTLSTLGNPAIGGKLNTSSISLAGRVFSIIGEVGPFTGGDSLLLPAPGDSWIFTGSPSDTGATPNEDGVVGTVTVATGRTLYTTGNLVEFHFAFDGNVTLDQYFQQNRSASSADIKLVIPRGDEPPVLGACCLPDGTCAEVTHEECDARGGTYKGDNVPCDNHTCADTGACCLPDGSCAEMFPDECEAAGGTYKGDNVPCDNHTCADTGACCLPDGSCAEMFQDDCEAAGGTYKGDNVPCDNHTCAETGACCLPDGSCAEMFQDECEAAGGTYKGDNVPCDNHTCADTGACCLPDGSCAEMFQDDCEAAGGTYKGDNVPCDNHTCAETGACCLPDGSCAEMFQDDCEAAGGTYKGDNTPCDGDTCAPPKGACCVPGTGECNDNVCENGRPKSLTFLYTGDDCANPDNNNHQGGEFSCSDDWNQDPIPLNPVRIRVTNKSDPFSYYAKVWFDGTISVGQQLTADAANAGQSRLYSDTYIAVIDPANRCRIYQNIHIDTSCCKQLNLNDVFASVTLVGFVSENGDSGSTENCGEPGGCEELTEVECLARGGTYNGDGVECSEDLCVQDCVITCPPDVSVCAGCGQCSATGIDLGRPTVDGDCDGVVITNDAPADFPIGTTLVTWTATVGNRQTQCQQRVTVKGTICGKKFFDKNVNGVQDGSEPGINGWRIELRDESGQNLIEKVYTKREGSDDGRYSFCVEPGTYTVLEVMPNGDWIATTPTSYTVTVGDGGCDLTRNFGNVCLGDGGGHTPGFWGNTNGECKMKDGGSANPELSMLRGLNLRKSDGNHFDPTTYDQFKSWLRAGNATNMAYMLSIHLASMALNVEGGYTRSDAVVHAPGCGNRGPGNNFITISDLMAAADRAPGDGLGADGYTPSGDPHRAIQECRKNALDAANNNNNFVRSEPCCFQSPY